MNDYAQTGLGENNLRNGTNYTLD